MIQYQLMREINRVNFAYKFLFLFLISDD